MNGRIFDRIIADKIMGIGFLKIRLLLCLWQIRRGGKMILSAMILSFLSAAFVWKT